MKEGKNMTTIMAVAVALIMGLLMTRVVGFLKLPDVTAYLIAGVLIGPYFLGQLNIPGIGFVSASDVHQYTLICNVALGFIAFSIGNEFRLEELKHYFIKVSDTFDHKSDIYWINKCLSLLDILINDGDDAWLYYNEVGIKIDKAHNVYLQICVILLLLFGGFVFINKLYV